MIKEVLVVEGKMDVVAIDKAVEADCIITEGFNLKPQALKNIEQAYKKRGIIIMTDPDSAGERIRKYLSRRFPEAKHAFVPVEEATANDDIGIEQAKPEAIRKALAKVRTLDWERRRSSRVRTSSSTASRALWMLRRAARASARNSGSALPTPRRS